MQNSNHSRTTSRRIVFVHSLFRSGSTYFYCALKRTGLCHVYHEPLHEILSSLSSGASDALNDHKEGLRSKLRHGFLSGGYFDEYAPIMPAINKTFKPQFSFELFFLGADTSSPDLKSYLDTLINGGGTNPVFQCTRTFGRIGWLRANYACSQVFLLRNPWDQWFSYKVDDYIAATPRLILSQNNLPPVLNEIVRIKDVAPLQGEDTQAKLIYAYTHPFAPDVDYFLFFSLWLYAHILGLTECDVIVDMDEASENAAYREKALQNLARIGLESVDLGDAHLHRAAFDKREQGFYGLMESQVIDIFRKHDTVDKAALDCVCEYLDRNRGVTFVSRENTGIRVSSVFEDAVRMREVLIANMQQNAVIVANLNQAIAERDARIADVLSSLSWKLTRPLRFFKRLILG